MITISMKYSSLRTKFVTALRLSFSRWRTTLILLLIITRYLLIKLDLSAAFDTIDHYILFQRFEHDFGIKGTALDWFKSYMSGRTFHVSLYGAKSDAHTLNYGIPQGSIIGPKAFAMYAQSVTTIICHHGLRYHIYADDIQLCYFFDSIILGDAAIAIFKLSMCAIEIRTWMTRNKLKLNDSKTQFFIAASSHNTSPGWYKNHHWECWYSTFTGNQESWHHIWLKN